MISDDAHDGGPALSVEPIHSDLSLDAKLIERLVQRVLEGEGGEAARLTIVLADHATVRDLNREFLDHDYDTDVLAFLYSGPDQPIDGEIVIDLDMAAERHEEFDTSFEMEASRYIVHGLLHLLGHRDSTSAEKREMNRLENHYLRPIGDRRRSNR